MIKKILLPVHDFLPHVQAGVENYTYNLAVELVKAGCDVAIFAIEPNMLKQELVKEKWPEGFTVYKVNIPADVEFTSLKESIYSNRFSKEFNKVLDEFNPDIVHFQHFHRLSLKLLEITIEKKIKTALTIHDLWHLCPNIIAYDNEEKRLCDCNYTSVCKKCTLQKVHYKRWRFPLGRISDLFNEILMKSELPIRNKKIISFYNQIGKIIVPSKVIMESFNGSGIDYSKMTIQHHGVIKPVNYPLIKPKNENSKINFVFCSRPEKEKGFDVLIETTQRLIKSGKTNFHLSLWVNPAQLSPTVRETIESLAKEYVEIKGTFKPDQLNEIWHNEDVLLQPSLWNEPYGLTVDEALARNRYVISSNAGAMKERIASERIGLIYDKNDPDGLLNSMIKILDNPGIVESASESGKSILSTEDYAKAMLKIYNSVE